MTDTWAVICSKGRPDVLRACLESLDGQIAGVVLVDNNDEPNLTIDDGLDVSTSLIVHRPGYPPNLSALNNAGIDVIEQSALRPGQAEWNVALLNDDVTVPEGWVASLVDALRGSEAAAAYTDRISRSTITHYTTPAAQQWDSMTVFACILRGELRLRWDEDLKWWYGDNDLDRRCRQAGGVLAVPGVCPVHTHPSQQTFESVELSAQTHLDAATYSAKWAGQ